MDAYIIIEEVPYRLNVDFEFIALSPIAVELSKASALGKCDWCASTPKGLRITPSCETQFTVISVPINKDVGLI